MSDPQVYHPNETEKVEGQLYCYKDMHRPCTAECVAYLPQPPSGPHYPLDAQWTHCLVLVNQEKQVRHLIVIASELTSASKREAAKNINAHTPQVPK